MSGHTPGPWSVSRFTTGPYRYDIVGPNGEDIGYANPSDGADEPTFYPVEANLRLMAAAPDLLAALKAVVERIDGDNWFIAREGVTGSAFRVTNNGGEDWTDEYNAIERAIEKAEGSHP